MGTVCVTYAVVCNGSMLNSGNAACYARVL